MEQSLAQSLICPACLPREISLRLEVHEGQGEEVEQGALACGACRRAYPIRQGIALLLPDGDGDSGEDPYTSPRALSAYLWSHFADLWDDPDAGDAYRRWADPLRAAPGLALDAGCAVGRLTLELAATGAPALGIDRSLPFIRLARRLARTGALEFGLTVEGLLEEPRHIRLPERLRNLNTEFLVADAQALPFPKNFLARVASLNLLDKLPAPRRHLSELDRVAALTGSTLLVSDPYSWSTSCAPPEQWLGGTDRGPYAGRGCDNLRRILARECLPPWQVVAEDTVPWVIRNHARHFELIRSHYLLAER